MKLQSREEAVAFLKFMLGERVRHLEDIRQIERTIKKIAKDWNVRIIFGNREFSVDGEKYTLEDIWVSGE